MKLIILKKLVSLILLALLIYGCSSVDYICVKVKKSAFIPDNYEINRDSLITGGIKICKMGQRYFHKPVINGGGGETFINYTIPPRMAENEFGTYIMSVKINMIKIIGKGKIIGYDGIGPAEVEFIANSDHIVSMTIIN